MGVGEQVLQVGDGACRTSAYSSTIFSRSRAARRRSCMSRMAWAWISLSLKLVDQVSGGLGRVRARGWWR